MGISPNGRSLTLSGCASDPAKDKPPIVEKVGSGAGVVDPTGATFTWSGPGEWNGTSTVTGPVTPKSVGRPNEPADEKDAKGKSCPTGTQEIEVSANVVSDTASGDTGGKVTYEECELLAGGSVTLEPGTVFAIGQGTTEPPGS
jgi:hypothetical protein